MATGVRVLLLTVITLSATAHAGTAFVSTTGNDASDGLSWGTAKRTVQAGLNGAVAGDEVWVAAGTYVECITLKAEVALYGGFAGSETDLEQRNWVTNRTILDGNQAGSVVTAPLGATASTRIDGFTVRNGYASYGGGIHCSGASPTIANNTITANRSYRDGGGIYCDNSSPVITNNMIAGNSTSLDFGSGGGIYSHHSSSTITNNRIAGNTAVYGGGGIYSSYSSLIITNNTLSGNTARSQSGPSWGGGIFCSYSPAIIANNVIAGNTATTGGGGIRCFASAATIVNDTITGNGASSGGGMHCESSSASPTIVNTIIAFNSSGIHVQSGPPALRYNCIYGNSDSNYSGLTDPMETNGNISVDPKIAGLSYNTAHISLDSPCVNAGDDSAVQAGWQDLDGQARVLGGRVDIGADESDGTAWPVVPNVIVRVAPDGNDANDGSSWDQPKRTVRAAIDAAAALGGEVWVKAGLYVERISLRSGAHVYGGFAGTETERSARDIARHTTILDANKAGTAVTAQRIPAGMATIDGFAIRNGNTEGCGGGIYCSYAWPVIANNAITSNNAYYGGGIYCVSSCPTIACNTIAGNTTPLSGGSYYNFAGGGIYCTSSSPTIVNNTIENNTAYTGGGIWCTSSSSPTIAHNMIRGNSGYGIYCSSSSPTIANNTITGNSGSAVCCQSSSPLIVGNAIVGNSASSGSGVYCGPSSSPTISGNTIAGNSTSDYRGAIYCASDSSCPTITNTIIAFNTSGIYVASGVPSLRYNCVYGNSDYDYFGLTDPTGTNGNISVDPGLAGLSYGNVHVSPDSLCVNAGDDGVVQAGWQDLDGQARILGGRVDIGADESDGTTWTPAPSIIVRVATNGDDANDGSSWDQPKRTVQAAIDAAAAIGGEVWVKSGIYQEQLTLRTHAHVYGGFAGTETERSARDIARNTTVLSNSD